jgi:AcrR family transcriptional regulator
MGERRESKKRETRQRISDEATALFYARGFEAVTLDEVASAAKVSKMTVFNYFARKEELMLDREDDLKLRPFREALQQRPKGEAPVVALRRVIDEWRTEKHPGAFVDAQTVSWWGIIAVSPSLKARLRELADEAAAEIAVALAGPQPDGVARLAAGLIVLTVNSAREEAIRVFERSGSAKKADAAFLSLIEHGFAAVHGLTLR